MAQFRLWAPAAQRVEVVIGGRTLPMERSGAARSGSHDGWWTADVSSANAGADYSFAIDGSPPLPDPRSAWQPHGVDGPSRIVDHSSFTWTDAGFQARPLSAALIYELHVGTFTPEGTFEAVIG